MTEISQSKLRDRGDKRLLLWLGLITAIIGAFLFAYLSTMRELVLTWESEPDYSHGYLVIPLAIGFLWFRRESLPAWKPGVYLGGLSLIAISIVMRVAGRMLYLTPVDGWSIVFWCAGATWLLFGRRVFYWSLPSLAFLFFMVPLPYRMEFWLSVPLQKIATKASCLTLQLIGQPALTEGNVIFLRDQQLLVAEACSGMRIFIGILALAYAYLIFVRRSWFVRMLLVASILPVAVMANVTRIFITALLYEWVSGEASRHFSHDWAGFIMIPYATAIFAIVIWYVGRLFPQVELLDVGQALRAKSSSD